MSKGYEGVCYDGPWEGPQLGVRRARLRGRPPPFRAVLAANLGTADTPVSFLHAVYRWAAQTQIVSKARIRLDSRKSVRSFKEIICVDISEFESYIPSHAVRSRRASLMPLHPTSCRRGERNQSLMRNDTLAEMIMTRAEKHLSANFRI
jgi:hypothetical protein